MLKEIIILNIACVLFQKIIIHTSNKKNFIYDKQSYNTLERWNAV